MWCECGAIRTHQTITSTTPTTSSLPFLLVLHEHSAEELKEHGNKRAGPNLHKRVREETKAPEFLFVSPRPFSLTPERAEERIRDTEPRSYFLPSLSLSHRLHHGPERRKAPARVGSLKLRPTHRGGDEGKYSCNPKAGVVLLVGMMLCLALWHFKVV
ncbi:hypothetical protein E2C01_083756 [Portunus trituberculatus]|uniref:Uncharacterized protein n=1 Tax=Portunus trituberculatus TaxID=210409 RepID=A0A5B7J249_PORTR|nr:hypothetical protein [Portunus trituberculatus]